MDSIQMEPIGKYKSERNGSAKASAWRNMTDQDMDDVAFLADSEKAREARNELPGAVAVCSQRRALCLAALVLSAMFATALLVAYAGPQPDCPCLQGQSLIPGRPSGSPEEISANKERISSNGAVFPWKSARLPTFIIPRHYNLWLHPNLTTGDLKGEVSIDFRVDRDTSFVVINAHDMNITERALFKSGGSFGPKIVKTLEYIPADQSYMEFKDKLRRRYNYTLSLRFTTKLERNEKHRGFFIAGSNKNRAAVSRFWLTHARSAFPCFDEPHFRATFKLTIVRDRFHVSLTNMPIIATEEAGFYLGHRLLQDEFIESPPMSPHMVAMSVCSLQRRAGPKIEPVTYEHTTPLPTELNELTEKPTPEISLYSDKQRILDESGPLLDWVGNTLKQFAWELNTSYPLPKLDIIVIEGSNSYSEGWGLITLSPSVLDDQDIISRLLAQQWFGGLVSPRWWSAQWLMEALTSVLAEKAPPFGKGKQREEDALLLEHVLPALRLDSSASVRAVASQRLERADIESASDDLSLHKGAALVSMAVRGAGEAAGRAALARLLRDHEFASADARDLWRALHKPPPQAWETWAEQPGYPLVTAITQGDDVVVKQERFVLKAEPPEETKLFINDLYTQPIRLDLEQFIVEPENLTEFLDEDINATTTQIPTTTTRRTTFRPTRAPLQPKWFIPLTFTVGPYVRNYESDVKTTTAGYENFTTMEEHSVTRESPVRWAENVTHLVWLNDTQMTIPNLGRHAWVRYNVGARGLYRVSVVASENSSSHTPMPSSHSERALQLDSAFVLARAGRMPAKEALRAIDWLKSETHWAPWQVASEHLTKWRSLLKLTSVQPYFDKLLATLRPPKTDQSWLSGSLLACGVSWNNPEAIKESYIMYRNWVTRNVTIPDVYQEAAFTSGILKEGAQAWEFCWRAFVNSVMATRPLLDHTAILNALASTNDDWLFYRLSWSISTLEGKNLLGGDKLWKSMIKAIANGACYNQGSATVWRLLRTVPRSVSEELLPYLAKCLHQTHDYYQVKELYYNVSSIQNILDTIALNVAWLAKAEPDLYDFFQITNLH